MKKPTPLQTYPAREKFLAEMDSVVPSRKLCEVIEYFYPKAGNGWPPIGQERMFRIYFLQHWFNLSNPVAEERLYVGRSSSNLMLVLDFSPLFRFR